MTTCTWGWIFVVYYRINWIYHWILYIQFGWLVTKLHVTLITLSMQRKVIIRSKKKSSYFVSCLRFKESYFPFAASWGTLQANIRKHKPACPLVEFASNRCACRYRLLADETSQELLWGKETSLNKVQCFVSQLKSYYTVP